MFCSLVTYRSESSFWFGQVGVAALPACAAAAPAASENATAFAGAWAALAGAL
ncbi:MAG: hypothetical protein LBL94_10800 [Prevotellaceae bacterium]|nr:hypothetical protein [Prevotellaceae bacterium]